jgi:uncharacterized protein YkwD
MTIRTWRLAAGLVWVGLLAACARQTPTPTSAPPTAVADIQAQRGLALVDSVEVRPPEAGSVEVVARGPLADACTRLDEATVERQAQVFVVTLFTWREAGPACPPGSEGYEHTQALAMEGLPAGDYLVVVNGVSASLSLGPADAAASPTPAAEATQPAEASAEAPTAQPSPLPPTAQPTTAASPTAAPTGSDAEPGNCVDKAAFYGDVTVPDDTEFKQGEQFVKTWKVRNEGTCTWRGYSLVFSGGEAMSGPLNSPLPEAPPETIVEISITLVSPTRGGSHLGNWEFQDAHGRRFGVGASGKGPVWVRISVAYSGREETVPPPDTVGSSPPPASPNACGATRSAGRESDVLSRINAVRAQQGLGSLSEQAQLSAAAAQHSQDMACFDFISHTGTDGTSWKHRVAGQGYANYNSAREIIFAGDVTFGADPAGAFDWWMNSQVHHDIILFPDVSEVGVASATNPARPNQAYYTVVFARPAPAPPRTRGQAHR